MRRMIEIRDGVCDAREQKRLDGEHANIRHQPALTHHGDLQHEDERRHQRNHPVSELWVFPKVHGQNRNVEIKASAPRMNATASSSGTRNRRSLALLVSTSTIMQQITSSFKK